MIPIGFVRGLLVDVRKGEVKEVSIDFNMRSLRKLIGQNDLTCPTKYIDGVGYLFVCGYHQESKRISAILPNCATKYRGNLFITSASNGPGVGLTDEDINQLSNRIYMTYIENDPQIKGGYSTFIVPKVSDTPNPTIWSE